MSVAEVGERVLYSTDLRDGMQLRVTTKVYRGVEYVSVRNYWRADDGEFHPTKKGVTVNVELVAEIVAALERAAGEAV